MTASFSSLHALPNAQLRIEGDLRQRLLRNFDRLEREEYQPDRVYAVTDNNNQWPGDTPGRTILALAQLERATGRKSHLLDVLYHELPHHLNERGYMGEATSVYDEQQYSGHGWLVAGLLEYAALRNDQTAYDLAERMVRNLFLPLRGQFHTYPCLPEERAAKEGDPSGSRVATMRNWALSSDIGCAFIDLEGLVLFHERSHDAEVRALIEEMFEVFQHIDFVGASLQLHASLTAIRNFMRFHNLSGDERLLQTAQRVYGLFHDEAMTENYSNYNWFNRPWWTEPCAVVDGFIVAVELWRKTDEARYLEDAQHIYFNALGYAQKPHGGFGCDCCLGAEGDTLFNKVFDVTWCCNMRGAIGLVAAAEYALLADDHSVVLPFYFDGQAQVAFPDGELKLHITTTYPYQGQVTVRVEESSLNAAKSLKFFLPSWVNRDSVQLQWGGKNVTGLESDGFVSLSGQFKTGDEIELSFPITLRQQNAINRDLAEKHSLRHGPLILGSSEGTEFDTTALRSNDKAEYFTNGEELAVLTPLNNVLQLPTEVAEKERRRVLVN